jgi:hypothetical protein
MSPGGDGERDADIDAIMARLQYTGPDHLAAKQELAALCREARDERDQWRKLEALAQAARRLDIERLEAENATLEESRALHESAWRTWEEKYRALEAALDRAGKVEAAARAFLHEWERLWVTEEQTLLMAKPTNEFRAALATDPAREVDAP